MVHYFLLDFAFPFSGRGCLTLNLLGLLFVDLAQSNVEGGQCILRDEDLLPEDDPIFGGNVSIDIFGGLHWLLQIYVDGLTGQEINI